MQASPPQPPKAPLPNSLRDISHPFKADLPELRKLGVIRVLTIYSQSYFFIRQGQPYGLDYALLEEYQHGLKRHHAKGQPPMEVVFIPVPLERLVPLLEAGYGDMAAAGLTITPERSRHLTFTRPYLTGVDEVVVSHKSVTGIASLDSLSGRPVLVAKGSSYLASLEKLNRDLASRGLKPVEILDAPDVLTDEDILDMVNSGVVPLTVMDSPAANMWAQVMPNIKVHTKLALRKGGRIAWLVRRDTPKLLESLNHFLKSHRQGTLVGNVLIKRYFSNNQWLKNPDDLEERSRFSRFAPLFKKYGEKYDFDWLLLAAQAFQESRLDPNCRSSAGAVGLMQVMPPTGGNRRAEIKRLLEPEYNVSVAVKYLAHIRDHYFGDPGLSLPVRARFSLAAYNAGPTALSRVRRVSKRLGYNPNLWFFNCEYGALHLVGSEPVSYVRNILKYYVSYKLSMGLKQESRQETNELLHK
ncbi:MAG: lytic transglycosylase F [Proteobacteria bacterium]|nr:lytic transglycosylase F [Pseudomonadota bacterium]MBU1449768.1 lytic transglycosylase F [Pseudomonadota bacterium]MBU2469005.1 lytic transglycosylase F [Pseudomonadota bacterium]MBU2517239.1 lytic transglycosylase F [Pseudomonadota bacterium]